ncbi:hypothetical protein FOXYSP1_19241 [Fusarium oxysporum f. sp. phaseoli]
MNRVMPYSRLSIHRRYLEDTRSQQGDLRAQLAADRLSHTHAIDGAVLLVPQGIGSARLLPEARTVRSLLSLRNHWIRLLGP